jgi:hypothetical protein
MKSKLLKHKNIISIDSTEIKYFETEFKSEHIIDYFGEYWTDENGFYHRDNGPAIINNNGSMRYCKHGELHRLDGPAVIYKNHKQWYINGERIFCKNNKEFLRIVKMKELL